MSAARWSPPEDPEYARVMGRLLEGVFSDSAEDATDRFALDLDYDWQLPAAEDYGKARGAELIGRKWDGDELIENPAARWVIDETTREEANAPLQDALDEGWSYERFSDRLRELGTFGETRADMIARTELGIAQVEGKKASFAEAGIDRVYVLDGDGDEECRARNGTIMDADDFELLHPNCEGDIRPLTREEREEDDGEGKAMRGGYAGSGLAHARGLTPEPLRYTSFTQAFLARLAA